MHFCHWQNASTVFYPYEVERKKSARLRQQRHQIQSDSSVRFVFSSVLLFVDAYKFKTQEKKITQTLIAWL